MFITSASQVTRGGGSRDRINGSAAATGASGLVIVMVVEPDVSLVVAGAADPAADIKLYVFGMVEDGAAVKDAIGGGWEGKGVGVEGGEGRREEGGW